MKRTNNKWGILGIINGPAGQRNQEKMPSLGKEENALSSRQCTSAACAVAMAELHELKFKLFPLPPYSPDLAPSDFFLFPNMEKWLAGKRFKSNENIITEAETYFEELAKSYILDDLKELLGPYINFEGFFCKNTASF